ncbi:amino acid ABC transporter permease [Acinetobacter qingfengensis]|uniref:Amino acid ABC transporter permease n=1 Tax=Acinetobacter qingfengensis TaxID=1262585 RepID=A0A1E7RF28_9GAMM|nr:amino acid ABC transporter permease [Acinetobacter qingfengensis]KAA8731878.1 amino acid ABC transporter permease [Acinetobacter qingfengensis]OEY97999.1 amino acid ABC transporter permease [Acinetobacter qingfengensis]
MNYNWNWAVLLQPTGVDNTTYLQWVLVGLGWLCLIAVVAWTIALVLGSLLGILRTLPNKTARTIGTTYVTIFRNIPLLIQLFIWFYVAPNFLPEPIKSWWMNDLSAGTTAFLSASIGLGLFTAARVCEQVRTGIEALPVGQKNAGYALGFTTSQLYRYVVLPQSFRTILPPLSSELTNCVKNTSIASLVGVAEIISQMKTISEYTQNTIEIYTYVTLIFIVINVCLIVFMNFLEKRLHIPGLMSEGGK